MLSPGVYPCRYRGGSSRTGHSTSKSKAILVIGAQLQCLFLMFYSEPYNEYKLLGTMKRICK